MEIQNLLREEIRDEFVELRGLEEGTAEHKAAVDSIVKLIDRAIEFEKVENEKEEKAKLRAAAEEKERFEREFKEKQAEEAVKQAEFERKFKEKQAEETKAQADFEQKLKIQQTKEDQIDRWIKNGITIAGIILPIGLSIWGTYKSFEFEKEGTVTTIMGRGYINKLIPKK